MHNLNWLKFRFLFVVIVTLPADDAPRAALTSKVVSQLKLKLQRQRRRRRRRRQWLSQSVNVLDDWASLMVSASQLDVSQLPLSAGVVVGVAISWNCAAIKKMPTIVSLKLLPLFTYSIFCYRSEAMLQWRPGWPSKYTCAYIHTFVCK